MDIENRVALVTGGTGALGSAVTLELLRSGARVAVSYRSATEWEMLEGKAAEHAQNLFGQKIDLTRGEEVERTVSEVTSRWGRIDYFVALAGGFAAGKSYQTDEPTWDKMFNLNLRSLVIPLRAVVPIMIKQNFGRIVTTSSGSILRGGGAGIAAYAVSKGAVRQLTGILADELKDYDIHVHCVLPGTMDTEANRKSMPTADFSKWVRTEDVARTIRTLLGDDTRAVRSADVPVLG
ncbi:MAG TPA: SDR family NAD(P)-dependent oxidoreductase [Terriglobia bacterium]|nr:SDR family NAD(P)-dependent oxidoreductase [Terriglobia bacterium]